MIEILWWYWILLSIVLMIVELSFGTIFIGAISISSLILGAITYFINIKFIWQVIIWSILSIILVYIAKKITKGGVKVSSVGQSSQEIGAIGVVIEPIDNSLNGKVEFYMPIHGSKIWNATSNNKIPVGRKVKIVAFRGQMLEVESIDEKE